MVTKLPLATLACIQASELLAWNSPCFGLALAFAMCNPVEFKDEAAFAVLRCCCKVLLLEENNMIKWNCLDSPHAADNVLQLFGHFSFDYGKPASFERIVEEISEDPCASTMEEIRGRRRLNQGGHLPQGLVLPF